MHIKDNLRKLRKEMKLTQRQLSQQTSITQSTLSRIEKGRINNLHPSTLLKLADALKVPLDYLVGRTDSITVDEKILTDPETKALLDRYFQLPVTGQKEIVNYAEFLGNKKPPQIV